MASDAATVDPQHAVAGLPGFTHRHLWVAPGTRLHYVTGGDGPPVVLVHGYPYAWSEWRETARHLAADGHTVVAPDIRGCGHSIAPPGRHTKREDAEDLHRIVRELDLGPITLVGTDIGTMIAHAYAVRYPDEVARLVLSEASLPGFGLEEAIVAAEGALWHFAFHAQVEIADMLTAGREREYLGVWWAMSARGLPEELRAELLDTYRAPGGMRGGFELYATLLDDGRWARTMPRVTAPVLVLNGDRGVPQQPLLDGARAIADDVRAEIVPDAGHTISLDNPAWLADRLGRFAASGR